MTEATTFLKAILAGDWDVAGVFADWLEEHGDPRGVLLRRRWKRWQKEHAAAIKEDREATVAAENDLAGTLKRNKAHASSWYVQVTLGGVWKAESSFRMYLREKFPQECYESSDPTNSQAYKDA